MPWPAVMVRIRVQAGQIPAKFPLLLSNCRCVPSIVHLSGYFWYLAGLACR